ncbi:hypothetical protein [Moritella viscosa]|uniref:hypothetical protein n=1 Tax=Moritella viscosa TaxID=80854 RepID=UPI000922D850|nr:hypothetical protein [Moritella viscosa]SGZ09412.1 50S ribosomal protein L4 [Moritella viscosa]
MRLSHKRKVTRKQSGWTAKARAVKGFVLDDPWTDGITVIDPKPMSNELKKLFAKHNGGGFINPFDDAALANSGAGRSLLNS